MTCAQESNICMDEGNDVPITFTFTDQTTTLPIDITGYTLYFTVKINKSDSDADAFISKTVTTFTDPTNGIATVTIDRADTQGLQTGTFYYDVQWDDTTPDRLTILKGKLSIKEAITDRNS